MATPLDSSIFAPERRRHRRVRVPIGDIIPVELDEDLRAARGVGLVENLSVGGVCVRLARYGLRVNTTLPLNIMLQHRTTPIRASAKICWVDRKHAGFSFGFVSEEALNAIRRWVADHTPSEANDPAASTFETEAPAGLTIRPPEHLPDIAEPQDAELTEVARTACGLLGGSGVAIAVRRGHRFECRASIGSAPALGTCINGEAGLSGLCLRTRQIVTCEDVRTDPRISVDRPDALAFLSACVVPVINGHNVVALITAFRDHPSIFDQHDLNVLSMAACAASILQAQW